MRFGSKWRGTWWSIRASRWRRSLPPSTSPNPPRSRGPSRDGRGSRPAGCGHNRKLPSAELWHVYSDSGRGSSEGAAVDLGPPPGGGGGGEGPGAAGWGPRGGGAFSAPPGGGGGGGPWAPTRFFGAARARA